MKLRIVTKHLSGSKEEWFSVQHKILFWWREINYYCGLSRAEEKIKEIQDAKSFKSAVVKEYES